MLELVKKNIHMNRWKGNATSQITLDDDFIVPDTMDDVDQVILDSGEIVIESVKNQGERVLVRGKMDFNVLYRKSEGDCRLWAVPFPLRNPSMCRGWKRRTMSSWAGIWKI